MSSPADTLPPTPFRNLFAASGASVYVLTEDPELVRAADAASAGRYPVEVARTWPELVEAAERGLVQVVLLDADAVPMPFVEAVAALNGAAPVLVALGATGSATARSLMSLLAERTIHRLIMKPADTDLTRLLLDSALARYEELREQSVAEELPLEVPIRPMRRQRPPRSSGPLWLFAVVLLTLAVGAVIVGEAYGVFQRPPFVTSAESE